MPAWNVKNNLEVQLATIAIKLALKMLERQELVILSMEPGDGYNNREDYAAVRVSDPGWAWLQENQDKLVFTPPKTETKPPSAAPSVDIPF